jgi:D-3-phosphoglycerate dehydrogenase / 2-oxoglutarate reductase
VPWLSPENGSSAADYDCGMKILIADKFEQSGVEALRGLDVEVAYEPSLGTDGLPGALLRERPDVLIVRSTKVPAGVLEGARGLRAIVRAGAGVDNIDVSAATAQGIAVCNCPGTNSVAVAELALAHLLCCDRRIPEQTALLRAGKWNKKEYAKARGLKGSTLGVIGLGNIGQAVVKRAQAFEMTIIGWDRFLSAKWAHALEIGFGGSDRESMLGMLGQCDAVTVHVALAPETRHMCNGEFFSAMKPGAYFINTSRGGIVDEQALRAAVLERGIRCGLDVYESQPAAPEAEWKAGVADLPGCSFSHHIGASTDQAQSAVAEETVRIVRELKERGRLENCVNMPQEGERDLSA